jgi:hypothetical protein
VSTYEEWRVTGTWDGADIDHVWTPGDGARDWEDGPHLQKCTVTRTDWTEVDA